MTKLPIQYTPLVFSLFMSCFMGFMMSGIVILINQGYSITFWGQWMHAFVRVWPIAFILIFLLRPLVTKLVSLVVVSSQ